MFGKKNKPRHDMIVALDVGTTKVCCFSARVNSDGGIRVIGIGYQLARGMRNGVVVDMDEAESSIRAAADAAEQMSAEKIRQVILNISSPQIASTRISIDVALNGHAIGIQDIRRIIDYASSQGKKDGHDLLHAIPVSFAIDGNEGVRDPQGMYGDTATATIHLVTSAQGPLKNLSNVVNRSHLRIENRVFSGYASGLACLVDDELELGGACIDLGGGTTNIAVFQNGALVHVDSIPVGGMHVTKDIAQGLSTSIAQAERLKTLYGSAISSSSDEREMLKVPLVGEENDGNTNQIPRSMLVQIIQPRIEETLEIVRDRLADSGFDRIAGRRVMLTGGGSQMQNLRDIASNILNKQVRIGKPVGFQGLPESTCGPAFSTCAGLLRHAVLHQENENVPRSDSDVVTGKGSLGKMLGWLRKNF